jgi:glutathione synthase/RimK-type ligase-like ATP-grasp enzyme
VPSEAVERFVDQLEEVNPTLEPSFVTYDELALLLDKDGIKVLNARTKKPLPTYDLIYFRTHQKKMEMASAMAEYATATNTNFIDLEVAEFRSHTKLSQYARLARYNLSIPKTVILHHTQLEHSFDFIVKNIKLPFVFKDVAADRGEANFLIRNEEDYEKAVKIAQESDAYVAAQQFISNEGDYRCLVLDKKLELVIKRQRQDDTTHLNNTSLGGRAELIDPEEIPSVVHRMAIKSAIVMSRQVAGVDLMQSSETGKWYILEVNNSPQIVGGTFTNEKVAVFAKFLREQAEK